MERDPWGPVQPSAGFLVVRSFGWLYARYAPRYGLTREVYALPRVDRPAAAAVIQYRGLDRDALRDSDGSELLAEVRLAELAREDRCRDGLVFTLQDAADVLQWLDEQHLADRAAYELVWGARVEASVRPPPGFVSLGFEASFFWSDHFSPSCDCLLFPRWHGTDRAGTHFLEHFRRLNRHGLFDTPEAARAFLSDYAALDWTETGDYFLVEVAIPLAGDSDER